VVLAELVWVAETCYSASREEQRRIVRRILEMRQLMVQEAETRRWRPRRKQASPGRAA
jgi:predicted nucleic-acid-binding protein